MVNCQPAPRMLSSIQNTKDNEAATMTPATPSIFDLSPAEKLQLVWDLWDDVAANPEDVPMHDWQKEELARRNANLQKNPASGLNWEEVKRRIRSRHGR